MNDVRWIIFSNINFFTFQLEKLTKYFSAEMKHLSCNFPNSLKSIIIYYEQSTGTIVGYAVLGNRNFTKKATSYHKIPYICDRGTMFANVG